MNDKEKIEYLINEYIKSCDYSLVKDIPNWVLRYVAANSIRNFLHPLMDEGVVSLK